MMRRLLTTLSVLILIMGLDISSFAAGAQEEGAAGKRVAVLFPGLVDDQSWNQAGFEGLTRLEDEGAEIAYTERVNQSQQVEVFRNYAQQGYDIIVGHGGEYMDAALQVAAEYPDLQFAVTNGNKGADNVTSFTLSYRDMGLLAGALAGLMTESNKLAYVAGQEIPVALDAADAGVLSAAEDEGVMAIGLYGDQSELAPNAHIGAIIADASELVYAAGSQALDGQVHDEGIAAGVVSIGHYSDAVPQEVQDQIAAIEEDLKSAPAATPA